MLPELVIPVPQPPREIPNYHLPTTTENLLTWDFVVEKMTPAEFYWLNTASPAGEPHSAPVWGIWYKNRVHFDGSPKTLWARHLIKNPHIAVHLPDAQSVVMIEGQARIIEDNEIDSATWDELDTLYRTKYRINHGSPYWVVYPRKVLAWDTADLKRMTRWIFP